LNGIAGTVTDGSISAEVYGKKSPLIPSPKVYEATSIVAGPATDQSRSIP